MGAMAVRRSREAQGTQGGWSARLLNRPAWVFDAAVTVLVAVPAASGIFVRQDHSAIGLRAALTAALILPLIFRRRYPAGVFCLMAAVAFLQWLLNVKLGADITLLVATYTVAATQSWRRILAAAGVMEIGIVLAVARWGANDWRAAIFLSGMVVAATALGFYFRTRRAYLAQLQERALRLEHERDQQGALAAAAERARIAREMHDIVAHHLTVMVALSDGAAAAAASSPERAAAAMESVSTVGRAALADTRRLLGVLREAGEPQARQPLPGLEGLDALITRVREAGLPTELVVSGSPQVPATGVQLMLYRLVQEALTNTMKHAGPGARARVTLTYSGTELTVSVVDDGLGTPEGPATTGHGLAGMRERVSAWGGLLEAGPLTGGGWQVSTRVRLVASDAVRDRPSRV